MLYYIYVIRFSTVTIVCNSGQNLYLAYLEAKSAYSCPRIIYRSTQKRYVKLCTIVRLCIVVRNGNIHVFRLPTYLLITSTCLCTNTFGV